MSVPNQDLELQRHIPCSYYVLSELVWEVIVHFLCWWNSWSSTITGDKVKHVGEINYYIKSDSTKTVVLNENKNPPYRNEFDSHNTNKHDTSLFWLGKCEVKQVICIQHPFIVNLCGHVNGFHLWIKCQLSHIDVYDQHCYAKSWIINLMHNTFTIQDTEVSCV
jgi:hypothetical protein